MRRLVQHALITVVLAMCAVPIASATPPDTLWTRILGNGTAYDVIELEDQSLVAVGYGYLGGRESIRVVKTTSAGFILWDRLYAGSVAYAQAFARRAFDTGDGGLLVAGTERQPWEDVLHFLKLDAATGDTLWTRVLKDELYQDASLMIDALMLPDGGFTILWGGHYTHLSQLSPTCNFEWTRTFELAIYPTALSRAPDGNFYIAGSEYNCCDDEVLAMILKTTASGDTLWSRAVHPGTTDELQAVEALPNGGCLAAGASDDDLLILELAADGSTSWSRTYANNGAGLDIELSTGSGFVVATTKMAGPGGYFVDLDLVKFDDSGFPVWHRQVGTMYDDNGVCVRETSSQGYMVSGFANYFGCTFDTCWLDDFWLVMFQPESVSGVPDERAHSWSYLSLSSNPAGANDVVYVTSESGFVEHDQLDLMDVNGRKVRRLLPGGGFAGLQTIRVETAGLTDGVYFVRHSGALGSRTAKLVIARP